MDERKQKVLLAIIRDYISTAEPVGSRTIARKYELDVSPATIRNEMADLEDMGLIEQPYTSAGRVPSDKGYRYYVDCLMEDWPLSSREKEFIRRKYGSKMSDLEQVISNTGDLLSGMTNYTAIAMGPQFRKSTLRYIELTLIHPGRALLLVMTDPGIVEHRFLDTPESINADDLRIMSKIISSKLCGKTLNNVTKTVLDEIRYELHRLQHGFLDTIFGMIEEVLDKEEGTKIYLDGTRNILKQPEFKNIEKLHSLLSILEEKRILGELISETATEGLAIRIGGENIYKGVHDCSLITATYSIDGSVVGSLSVLGPTRMDYSKVVTLVSFITDTLSEALTNYYGLR